jgi:hypothetical protein
MAPGIKDTLAVAAPHPLETSLERDRVEDGEMAVADPDETASQL